MTSSSKKPFGGIYKTYSEGDKTSTTVDISSYLGTIDPSSVSKMIAKERLKNKLHFKQNEEKKTQIKKTVVCLFDAIAQQRAHNHPEEVLGLSSGCSLKAVECAIRRITRRYAVEHNPLQKEECEIKLKEAKEALIRWGELN